MKLLFVYIPFQILIGVILGILFPPPNILCFYFVGVIFLSLGVVLFLLNRMRKRLGKAFLFYLFIIVFGILSSWSSQYLNNDLNCQNHYHFLSKKDVVSEITLTKKLKSTQKYHRFYADVSRVQQQKSCGSILVEVPSGRGDVLEIGDVLVCKTSIYPIDSPSSPYHFNYQVYLERRNVFGKIRLQSFVVKERFSSVFISIQKFRNKLVDELGNSVLSQETKGLMMAMLLGDRKGITSETQQSFADAGVVHLIAISGMHVGVLYFLLLTTFGCLKRIRHGVYLYVLVVLISLWGFAVFSGLSSSVVRCVTMFSFITVSRLSNRKTLLLEPIISSALILLWIHPDFLFDAGFQLSYTAVISIVVFYPLLTRSIKFNSRILQYFFDVLLVSIIAQLGVLPVSLYYFHQFPFQFLIANFFAVSLLPVVLYGGLLVLLKVVFVKVYVFLEVAFDHFILFYLETIRRFALWHEWILKDVFFDGAYILCYYLVMFCVWRLLVDFKSKNILGVLSSVFVFQLTFLFLKYDRSQKRELVIQNNYFHPSVSIIQNNCLNVMAKDSLLLNEMKSYQPISIKNGIHQFEKLETGVFSFENNHYLIVSKKINYEKLSQKGMMLILRGNPKINLERLIKELSPKKIIIEANNYKSNVLKWKSTCEKLQVPFYDVKNQGAYVATADF